MKKKRKVNKDRRKFLSWSLIILILLLVIALVLLFNHLKDREMSGDLGDLKTIGVVSVDDDEDTTSIIDISITNEITKELNFTHLDISDSVPYTSLSLYLPFDEDDITNNAYDYVGDLNAGVNGVPPFVDCIYGKCYDLDGDNDIIALGDNFDFGDDSFTISLWVRGNGTNMGVVSKDNFEADVNGIVIVTNGSDYIYKNGTSEFLFGDADLNWHHLAVTRNSVASDRISTYYDGQLITEENDERTFTNSFPFVIGAINNGEHFNGQIDEFMIFDASLDAAEISNIYNNQSARYESEGTMKLRHFNLLDNVGNNVVEVTVDTFENLLDSTLELRMGYWDVSDGYDDDSGLSINNGLIGYWHADGNANDASSQDNNGVEESVSYGEGVWDEAFSFDGGDDFVNISSVEDDFNLENGSISLWFNTNSLETGDRYFSHSGGDIAIELESINNINFKVSGVSTISSEFEFNRWVHVVGIYNDSGSKLYVNGVEISSSAGTPNIGAGAEYYLGLDDSSSSKFASGLLDEVMIFNRAITGSEIETLYVQGRAKYEFTDYQTVDGDNEYDITDETSSLLPEFKFSAGSNRFTTPLLFTGLHFDYDSIGSGNSGGDVSFPNDGIVNIVTPFNNSNVFDRRIDVNYTVAFSNISSCWYSNGTFSVNITLNSCENITDVVWRRGDHEVRVYANSSDGNVSADRVFFEVFTNHSGTVVDDTINDDFNQSDPITDSPSIELGVGETLESAKEEDGGNSVTIVYYLIIGILMIMIFIVIFFLIKASKAHGIIH